jgi:hypothetical protein
LILICFPDEETLSSGRLLEPAELPLRNSHHIFSLSLCHCDARIEICLGPESSRVVTDSFLGMIDERRIQIKIKFTPVQPIICKLAFC